MSEPTRSTRDHPPLPLRVLGQATSALIARAPWLWPVLRGPTMRWWDRAAGEWDQRINPDDPEHLAPLAAACDRLEGAPDKVLELGAGTGAGARLLTQRYPGAAVIGVDLSAAMVSAARAKLDGDERVRFMVADAGALPFADGEFDLVAQLNLPVYFAETARVLRPGGHVIVASSLGAATPYFTPTRVLKGGFARHGVTLLTTGEAGVGSFVIAQRREEA